MADGTKMGRRYCVVSPARNEEANLPGTIASMVSQTIRPVRWVIVDDGSSDATGAIAEAAAREHAWIEVLHRPDRGARKQGGGVVETFNEGYERVRGLDWDYVVKFDGDLSFEPDYFERCLLEFEKDSKLGIGGGTISVRNESGKLVRESDDPEFHVRGATKIYRRGCWDQLGGLHVAPGWDTLDELKANMLGWTTRTFPDIPLEHHRHTGAADGTWKNWVKNGRANFITGYHPIFMVAKVMGRVISQRRIKPAFGLLWGFFSGYWEGAARVPDAALIRYVRDQQMRRLMGRPSLWS